MDNFLNMLFFIAIGWQASHELDAIQQHEWRIFPFIASLNETTGYRVFVIAHIPLFAAIIGLADDRSFQIGFDLFLIAHVGLHWLYRKHPQFTFNNAFSQSLIVGAGLLGGLHLILLSSVTTIVL